MLETASTGDMIYLSADVLICIFMFIAATTATRKKHYIALGIIALSFILSLFLYAWIILVVSLGYIIISGIWFRSEKDKVTTIAEKFRKNKSENNERKIRCRFCGKRYSPRYNKCFYCKKK